MKVYLLMYEFNNFPDYDSIIKRAYLSEKVAESDCNLENSLNLNDHVLYYVTSVECVG